MPIFVDYKRKHFIYTSYKVAYSTLLNSKNGDLKYLHYQVDYAIYKHLIKYFHFKRYQLIRHPYNRFLSLFKDKFRVEPTKYQNSDFKWQPVHYILFPYLGLANNATDADVAKVLLSMDINDFVLLMPKIYLLDGHLAPQNYTSLLKISDTMYLPLRVDKYCKIESGKKEISQFIGIDFDKKRNVTNSNDLFEDLNTKSLTILKKLYRKDFELGDYSK